MARSAQSPPVVAIIGDGIAGAFAAQAAADEGWKPVVFSPTGEFSSPPAGAFYLHDLPDSLIADYEPQRCFTTVLGPDPTAYSRKLWGAPQATSVDAFKPGQIDEVKCFPFVPEMMARMLSKAEVLVSGKLGAPEVLELAKGSAYDAVVVTAPISFHPEVDRPETREFITLRVAGRNRFTDAIASSLEHVRDIYGPGSTLSFAKTQTAQGMLWDIADEWGEGVVTLYSGSLEHMWLRLTQHLHRNPDGSRVVDLELPYGMYTMDFWRAWAKTLDWPEGRLYKLFQELRTSLKRMQPYLSVQRKIAPAFAERNPSPADNVLLSGRWATWRRGELSHETYDAVSGWLRERSNA